MLRVDLNRRYWNESIPLRRLLGLGPDYRGYRVQSVTVKLRSPRRHHYRHNSHYGGGHGHFQHRPARLSLLTNGYVADRARAGGSRRIKLYPGENDVLGREIGRMQLAVRGRAFIDSIKVELSPPRPRHFKGRGRGHRANGDNYDVNEHLAATVFRIILNNIELADGRH